MENARVIYLPIDNVFAIFWKKLKEANCFLEQPIVVFSVIDEIRNKQHLFESFQEDESRRLKNPHHGRLCDLAQTKSF